VVLFLLEGPLSSLLASLLATRTFRPTVVVPIWSVTTLTAFPTSSRVVPNAFPPSVIADFAVVRASALTSGFPALSASLLSILVDLVASR
jgi:hypothetical protein